MNYNIPLSLIFILFAQLFSDSKNDCNVLAQTEGDCPYYRSTEKVRYARGFVRMIRSLPVNVSEAVAQRLIARFGRNAYYDMRKGKRAIAPAEQEIILAVVAECGAQQEFLFDAYEEKHAW